MGVRDSCGKSASKGETPQAQSLLRAGPPAESECPTFQSTLNQILSSLSTVKNRHLAVFLIDD
ncbi:hypothetical protein ACWGJQ_03335 [Peribacillus simplex]